MGFCAAGEASWGPWPSRGRTVPLPRRAEPALSGPEGEDAQTSGRVFSPLAARQAPSAPRAREALGAPGDEVRLPVLPAALRGFRLKWGEDPGDAVAAGAQRPPAPHPGSARRAPGLGGRGLEGAAGGEAGDEPRSRAGLAAGRGEVRPRRGSRAG
ncbi:protein EOLA2 isoform X2 [Hippopotamus amphibius kiboko]|uniref:protein EOLA2 isoform X2 n=1 Tax=Hippopotamus amphibius kiboko TaxID=575201 RepID=UPI002597DDD9|nr:protein EOLA2 isoform X2 [Hippopotamus amphibius kiboko]